MATTLDEVVNKLAHNSLFQFFTSQAKSGEVIGVHKGDHASQNTAWELQNIRTINSRRKNVKHELGKSDRRL